MKKFCAQFCLKYFIPSSAWDKIKPLHLEQNKKFSKLTYYSHIHYGYHAYIQWYVLKKEIKISSDFKHSRFHCVWFGFGFFSVVGRRWSFFFGFWFVWVYFSSVCMKPMNKEQLFCFTPPTLYIHEQGALKQIYVEQQKLSSVFRWNYLCPTGTFWAFVTYFKATPFKWPLLSAGWLLIWVTSHKTVVYLFFKYVKIPDFKNSLVLIMYHKLQRYFHLCWGNLPGFLALTQQYPVFNV